MQSNPTPSQGGAQKYGLPQQRRESPSGRFMGMSPAPIGSTQLSAPATPAQWVMPSYGQESSPIQPRNLQVELGQMQATPNCDAEGVESSDDSDIDPLPTPAVDYESWSADQIRKECTRRKLKLKSTMKKDERIAVLRRYDAAHAAMDDVMLGDAGLPTGENAVSRRTKHCMYRMINFLFSDEFATRYSQTGDTAPRADVDSKSVNAKSTFWQEFRAGYIETLPKTHERNLLMFEHELFTGINPSVTKPHSAEKLFGMAKELLQKYFTAEQRFTKSGQHENEFHKFVDNQGAVLYLRMWLKLKPELINFVKGGLFEEDELDTLDLTTSTLSGSVVAKSPNYRYKQREGVEALKEVASALLMYVTDRRDEAERVRDSAASALSQRSQVLSMLGDIRKQLGDIDRAIVASHGDEEATARLLEDRNLLLQERESWMEKLRPVNG